MRRLLRGAVVVAMAGLAVLLGAGTASAHAELDSSDPANGASLPTTPPSLDLRFSLPVETATARVALTDGGGRPFAVGPASGSVSGSVSVVSAPLPALPVGSYRITWSVLSSDDLHVVSGVIAFGVGQAAPAAGELVEASPDPAESVARWLGFAGLALLLGSAALGALRPDESVRAAHLLSALAVVGGAVALVGDLALLGAQAAAAAGPGGSPFDAAVRLLTTPPRAPRWWVRELSLAVLLGCAVAARRGGARRAVVLLGAAAALGVGTTGALLGHSVGSGPLRVFTDAAHELSAMTWAGGLVAVALVLRGRPRDAVTRALLRRFSALAAACVAVLTVTGLMLTGSGVASIDALLLSHFGDALLVKVALMAAALAFALVNTVAVHGDRRRPSRAALACEAGLVVAALGAAAVLGASPHATGPVWHAADAAVPVLSGTADDLVETLAVGPNLAGSPNVVTVTVLQTRRPAPGPVGAVTVTMTGPGGAVLTGSAHPVDATTFALTTDRLTAGTWDVTVTATRPGTAPAVTAYRWPVADPAAPGRATVFSSDPIDVPLGIAAAAVAVLAGAVPIFLVWRRRRTRPVPAEVRT